MDFKHNTFEKKKKKTWFSDPSSVNSIESWSTGTLDQSRDDLGSIKVPETVLSCAEPWTWSCIWFLMLTTQNKIYSHGFANTIPKILKLEIYIEWHQAGISWISNIPSTISLILLTNPLTWCAFYTIVNWAIMMYT